MYRALCILLALFLFQSVNAVNLDTVIDAGCTDNSPLEKNNAVPASPGSHDQDSITITRDSGGYTIRVVLFRDCCLEFATEFRESHDTLFLSIKDTDDTPCDCICHYPFLFRLSGFAVNTYYVVVLNRDRTVLTSEFTAASQSVLPAVKKSRLSGRNILDEVYDLRGRRIIGSGMEKNKVYIRRMANLGYKRVTTF